MLSLTTLTHQEITSQVIQAVHNTANLSPQQLLTHYAQAETITSASYILSCATAHQIKLKLDTANIHFMLENGGMMKDAESGRLRKKKASDKPFASLRDFLHQHKMPPKSYQSLNNASSVFNGVRACLIADKVMVEEIVMTEETATVEMVVKFGMSMTQADLRKFIKETKKNYPEVFGTPKKQSDDEREVREDNKKYDKKEYEKLKEDLTKVKKAVQTLVDKEDEEMSADDMCEEITEVKNQFTELENESKGINDVRNDYFESESELNLYRQRFEKIRNSLFKEEATVQMLRQMFEAMENDSE